VEIYVPFSIGFVGAGQFASHFASLFRLHPGVERVYATDLIPERADKLRQDLSLDGVFDNFDALIESDEVDAVALFTQRWTHGDLAVKALRAGKDVYSAVPMAITRAEIAAIIEAVKETGQVYMMGETSYYNPAVVFARKQLEAGEFGSIFYSEGDYIHDMDLGFYDAYRFSGGEAWKETASYPPMLYPTHSIGGVLGVVAAHAVSVSCLGVVDRRGDGVFDRKISQFGNDFSNASALFELSDGGVMRINEMRRVGYPSPIRESRFRFFGTDGSFEQIATLSVWQDKQEVYDVSSALATIETLAADDPSLADISPALRAAFSSGHAQIHDVLRLPKSFEGAPNGHEGSHQFLVDDFVNAVEKRALPSVNAWVAARFTLPGIVAHESALNGGERLVIDDFGDAPATSGPRADALHEGRDETPSQMR
jgi:predicted dehydrogenase